MDIHPASQIAKFLPYFSLPQTKHTKKINSFPTVVLSSNQKGMSERHVPMLRSVTTFHENSISFFRVELNSKYLIITTHDNDK